MAMTRSSFTPALTQAEVADLVVNAVTEASVAARVATVHRTTRKALTFPAVTGDVTAYAVAEAAQITLSDVATGEITLTPTKYVAATRASNESLEDTDPAAATLLGDSISRAIAAKIDADAFGTAGLSGLAGVSNGGTTDLTSTDAFLGAQAAIRNAGATPTAILVSPNTALRLATMKESGAAGTRRNLLQPSPQDAAVLAIGGVPIVVTRAVPDTVALTIDGSRLAYVIRKDAAIEVDRSAFAMTRESLVIGEARATVGTFHVASVAKTTVSPAA